MGGVGVAGRALDDDVVEPRVGEEFLELFLGEPLVQVLQLVAHPVLVVREQVDDEQFAARCEDAYGL